MALVDGFDHFGAFAFTPSVRRRQATDGSADVYASVLDRPAPVGLGPDEIEFVRERDSFYLASVGEGGWPYVQHRGGPAGFVRVLDATHLAWIERRGNRQFVTAGNVDHDDRVAIIAVDYPTRSRLKLLGHATFHADPSAELLVAVGAEDEQARRAEGVVTVRVVAFDWNCAKHITPRYTEEQVRSATAPLLARIAELEAALAAHAPT